MSGVWRALCATRNKDRRAARAVGVGDMAVLKHQINEELT